MEDVEKLFNESRYVSKGMIEYGGSFVYALGQALLHADMNNIRKIKATWPEYWEKYLNMRKLNNSDEVD